MASHVHAMQVATLGSHAWKRTAQITRKLLCGKHVHAPTIAKHEDSMMPANSRMCADCFHGGPMHHIVGQALASTGQIGTRLATTNKEMQVAYPHQSRNCNGGPPVNTALASENRAPTLRNSRVGVVRAGVWQ